MTTPARALSIPFGVDSLGRIGFSTDPAKQVADRLVSIVGTIPGERVMRPTYGVPTTSYLFASNDSVTLARLRNDVEAAIAKYEPKVKVADLNYAQDPGTGVLGLLLSFTLIGSEQGDLAVHTAFIQTGGTVNDV